MGVVTFGPPKKLILRLAETYGLRLFVETGTYFGGTSTWAAQHFERVYTVELSRPIYEKSSARLASLANVTPHFGDSRSFLEQIIPTLEGGAIFWLDSHWSGGETYGEEDECPLLEELRCFEGAEKQHAIFIDDARLFLAPPPLPHKPHAWPTISEVCNTLQDVMGPCYIVVIDDVIIALPEEMRQVVVEYGVKVSTSAWEEKKKESQQTSMQKALDHFKTGAYQLAKALGLR